MGIIFLSHFIKCTEGNKRSCCTQRNKVQAPFSKTSACQRETKHFNISKSTKKTRALFVFIFFPLLLPYTCKVFPLWQTKQVLWCFCLALTAAAPKALKLFRSAAIHLLSCASGRLHPCSPTKTYEVWSAFVHELKVTMKPLRCTEISHWGIFYPDKADPNSLLKGITWNFRLPQPPPFQINAY